MNDAKYIVLCPGQGAQHVGMGQAWAEQSNAVRECFGRADEILGIELSKACFDGPDEMIHRTDYAQAGLFVCAAASALGIETTGEATLGPDTIVAAAGLSLGEYSALHLAGVMSFEDGLRLVWQRGRFMQEAAEGQQGSMLAVIGADEPQARQLCAEARQDDILVPANFNCPGQVVISGTDSACERALTVAEKKGLRATPLTVAGAFHSPLMQPAADRMADELARVDFQPPTFPVLSNVTGEPHGEDVDEIKRLLVEQIVSPVRFEQNLRWLVEHANGRYLELAPGKVISGLMRRTERKVKVENYAQPK